MYVQKYLVEKAICSRKEAEVFLREGLIFVNGKKAQPGVPLSPTDVVTLAPAAEKRLGEKTTIAIYKPRGVVCSIGEDEGTTIFDIFPQFKHLNIVGRLDKESEGLLLLSNDGLITKAVTGDTHQVEKEYDVTVQEHISTQKMAPMMDSTLTLDDQALLPVKIKVITKHSFNIILQEGKNRQIRRMCGAFNLSVTHLKRIRIGEITLGTLKPGNFRKLTPEEISDLRNLNTK